MTVETEVAALTSAVNLLTSTVNVSKATLDASVAAAEAAYDSFDDRYLGAKVSAPSLDNDGGSLLTGALYFNSTENAMYVYTGASWVITTNYNNVTAPYTLAQTLNTNGNNVTFGDNGKAIFGAGSDLQIYHDGTTNKVVGSIDVTGTATMDGLTVSSTTAVIDVLASTNEDASLRLREDGTGIVGAEFTYDGGDNELILKVGNNTNTKRLSVSRDTGDISFFEDQGVTPKFFWDASAESLGIGTTSPNQLLSLNSTAAGERGISFDQAGVERVKLLYTNSSGAFVINNTTAGYTSFENNGAERMRIDSSGNVGIGTSSPDTQLHVRASSGDVEHRIEAAGSGNDAILSLKNLNTGAGAEGHIRFMDGTTTAGAISYLHNASGVSDAMKFNTNAAERMRIDSLGNASFNTTDISPAFNNVFGTAILQYGGASMSRTNSTTLDLNRSSSDGAIVNFRKDGTAVGSIGTDSGDLTIYSTVAGHTGFRFGNGEVYPTNNGGSLSDNTMSLGSNSIRFKDLYLSGGVVFGTTGGSVTSKTLDDYEEGTWTPAYTPTTGTFTTITTVATGRYTKVGRLVTVFASIKTSGTLDVTGASGNLKITGLPFACNATTAGGGADIYHQSWNLGTDILNTRMYVGGGASEILMYKNTMNGSAFPSGNITVADMSTSGGSFSNLISFTASYEV